MPLPIMLAHRLASGSPRCARRTMLPYLRPDGKTQVTVRYEEDEHGRRPGGDRTSAISTQHRDGLDIDTLLKPDLDRRTCSSRSSRASSTTSGDSSRQGLLLLQPDRQVRRRRSDGRHRSHRPEDHRRHVRGRGAARRRSLLGQGPDEGRPLGGVRGALRGEERRRRRARRRAARSRSRTRSASRIRCRSSSRRSAPRRCRCRGSRRSSASTSTCARPRSCATSTCAGRSTRRRPPTATSAARTRDFTWERTDKADALRAAAGLADAVPAT